MEQQGSLNEDILSFAELVLKSNNFEFNGKQYRGTTIWTRICSFVCKHFYGQVGKTFDSECRDQTTYLVAVHDDIFNVWTEGEEKLRFIDYLNSAHETIKFTNKWSKYEIEFLDIKVLNE